MNEPPPREEDIASVSTYEQEEDSKIYEDLYLEQVRLKEENIELVQHVKELEVRMASEQEQKAASLAEIETDQANVVKEMDAVIMNLNLRLKEQEEVIELVTKEKNEHVERLQELEERQTHVKDDSEDVIDKTLVSVEDLTPTMESPERPSAVLEGGDAVADTSNEDAPGISSTSHQFGKMPPAEAHNIEELLAEIEALKMERDEAVQESKRYKESSSEEPNSSQQMEAQVTPEKPPPIILESPRGEQEESVTPSTAMMVLSSGENSPEKLFAKSARSGMVSAGALSSVLDSLISKKQSGAHDDELYNDAIQMLQEELSKLTVKVRKHVHFNVLPYYSKPFLYYYADGT